MQGKSKRTKKSRTGGGTNAKKRKLPEKGTTQENNIAVVENAKENDSNSSIDEELIEQHLPGFFKELQQLPSSLMPEEQQKPFCAKVLPDEYLVNGTADEVAGAPGQAMSTFTCLCSCHSGPNYCPHCVCPNSWSS